MEIRVLVSSLEIPPRLATKLRFPSKSAKGSRFNCGRQNLARLSETVLWDFPMGLVELPVPFEAQDNRQLVSVRLISHTLNIPLSK